jgi:ATP-dependent DNA helicase RecQ
LQPTAAEAAAASYGLARFRRPQPSRPASQPSIAWPEIGAAARSHFGIRRFRPGQREILEEVLGGRSALGLMPTGAGKSLTFQLPALFLPKPVVVISPLIALMQDQQEHAAAADIAVQKLDSTLTTREAAEAEAAIDEGTPQLIYVTPERLNSEGFVEKLLAMGP